MEIAGLDAIDNSILTIIKDNARLSYSEIGEKIGISRVAVKNHMEALEKKGIIQGYKTIIDPTKIPEGIVFLLDLEVIPEQFDTIVRNLNKQSLIRRIYTVSGECKIHAEGMGTSKQLVNRFSTMVYNMYGVKRLGFHIVLDTLKDADGGVDYEQRIKENEICSVSEPGVHEN